MKIPVPLIMFVLILVTTVSGCIPSAPSSKDNAPAVLPSPTVPAPSTAPPQEEPAPGGAKNAAASQISTSDPSAKSHLQVPLDTATTPVDAVALPIIALVPLGDNKGYTVNSRFPIEGLAMEGTLLRQSPGKWLLSGQFRSDRASFAPGKPSVQAMGAMTPKEGGGLAVTETAGEMIITFPAPLPPAEEPKLPESKVIPFTLTLDAPDNTIFSIMLLPF
ncbi:MAG: hypothetical protein BWY09_01863 [Candidatus Hydrogenedentes bacterium ADurb.Bin179]|nr:MAG: hypothetical protein BWY09_01863 [Candidatus Hydrogenedentes bacterium ADurb.Bin179]